MKTLLTLIMVVILCVPVLPAQSVERSESIVTIEGESFYVHTVLKKETLYSLSKLYEVAQKEIKSNNPQIIDSLKEGQVLKIPAIIKGEKLSKRKHNRIFDTHAVNKGETLSAISRRYEILVTTLLEDNEGLDPAHLSIGQKINIRKKSKGDASPIDIQEQMEEYRDAINSVSDKVTYHLVGKGETIYGLSKRYGVTQESIKSTNDLPDGGLKAGAMIKIPGVTAVPAEEVITIPLDVSTQQEQTDKNNIIWPWGVKNKDAVEVNDFSAQESLDVALMLPLQNENSSGDNFLGFYRGVLLAMEDLKAEGISARLSLYNTNRSSREVDAIVRLPEFAQTDIIIGPIYEECLGPVLKFAEDNGAAIVSPLAILEKTSSSLLYQMAPDTANKYDKLKELIGEGKNVIYVTSEFEDEEMDQEIKPFLPQGYREMKYYKGIHTDAFSSLIDRRGDNVFVISCVNELVVDQILATISSIHNNQVARNMSNGELRVVGSARWARFRNNVDKNLYFKLKLTYLTSYHADRGDERVRNFDKRYVAAFGALPTLYCYRGYDAAKLFVGSAMIPGGDYASKLNSGKQTLLQMGYHFAEKTLPDGGKINVNDQWALVCYNSDYTIVVK